MTSVLHPAPPIGAHVQVKGGPALAGVPVVVETPSQDDGHAKDIALLSALRDGTALLSA